MTFDEKFDIVVEAFLGEGLFDTYAEEDQRLLAEEWARVALDALEEAESGRVGA